jgi:uncharacterized protein
MSQDESPDDVKISGLFSYPVKSCRGIAHERAALRASGLENDRAWMLVDPRRSPAQFITQRECAEMATIDVELLSNGSLRASKSGSDEIVVASPLAANALIKVKVWKSEIVALDAGDAASRWFASALGLAASAVRLVQFHPQQERKCNTYYAGDSGAHTFFADGYPVLVASDSSLADLNRRMNRDAANALPMNRFRPNLVITGLPAWDEDHIELIETENVTLKLVKPCVRCQITTTDQTSGVRLSEEPLNTLSRFRNNPDLGGVTFGWNAVVLRAGTLTLNERATIAYRF